MNHPGPCSAVERKRCNVGQSKGLGKPRTARGLAFMEASMELERERS